MFPYSICSCLLMQWMIFTIIFVHNMLSENVSSENARDDEVELLLEKKQTDCMSYSIDPTKTKRLALTEENLVSTLSEVIEGIQPSFKNHLCNVYLHKYLSEFDEDLKIVNGVRGRLRADTVTENPNLALKMIRRLVVTLFNKTRKWCEKQYPQIGIKINDIFTTANLMFPIQEDLDEALEGLLRIQFFYGLNATSEIRLGIFQGVETGAYLNFDDCMALAKKAIEIGVESIAYQWLVSASLRLSEMPNQRRSLLKSTRNDLEETWLKLQNLTKAKSLEELDNLLRSKRQEQFYPYLDYHEYATCRGEVSLKLVNLNRLHCFYQSNWHPYFCINPVKTQIVSESPLIFQFFDFVGDQTIEFIRRSSQRAMKRSTIVSVGEDEYSFIRFRTSVSAWHPDNISSLKPFPKLVSLSRKIEKLTGLEVLKGGASHYMQVVMYGALGGHYDFHLDGLQGTGAYHEEFGDRMATFLMFLKDVKLGGYTAFPTAGTFVKPEKGSAILWYNLWLNGTENELTFHGGCPVILGSKEVANRWILQYENMFKKPCSLDSDK